MPAKPSHRTRPTDSRTLRSTLFFRTRRTAPNRFRASQPGGQRDSQRDSQPRQRDSRTPASVWRAATERCATPRTAMLPRPHSPSVRTVPGQAKPPLQANRQRGYRAWHRKMKTPLPRQVVSQAAMLLGCQPGSQPASLQLDPPCPPLIKPTQCSATQN